MNQQDLKILQEKVKLIRTEKPSNSGSESILRGSSAEHNIVDLSDKLVKDQPVIVKQLMTDNLEDKIEILFNNDVFGFSTNQEYIDYFKHITTLYSDKNLEEIFSIEYLRDKILVWLVRNKIDKKWDFDINKKLGQLKKEDAIERIYYYPINNLDIEQEFNIGPHKITFFKKERFDKFFEKIQKNESSNLDKDEFDKEVRKFQESVFASVKIKAEPRLAEKLAFEQASLLVDILKIFTPTVYFPQEHYNIELEGRVPAVREFLTSKENEVSFGITKNRNGKHLNLSLYLINNFNPFAQVLSGIFFKDDTNELRVLVKSMLPIFSKGLNDQDLHRRTATLISICESIFLFDEDEWRLEPKCKRRMSYFLLHTNPKEKEKFSQSLSKLYKVRHKIQHKSKKIHLDLIDLRDLQLKLVESLIFLMKQSRNYSIKQAWLKDLDKKSSA